MKTFDQNRALCAWLNERVAEAEISHHHNTGDDEWAVMINGFQYPLFTDSLDSIRLIEDTLTDSEFWYYTTLRPEVTGKPARFPIAAQCAEALCRALGLWIEEKDGNDAE